MEEMFAIDVNNIPQWREKYHMRCPKCRRLCFHDLFAESAPKVCKHENIRGSIFNASYKCSRVACSHESFYGAFVPFKVQPVPLFADDDYE